MSTSPGLSFFLKDLGLDRRIRKESKVVILLVDLVVEEAFWETKSESDGAHD